MATSVPGAARAPESTPPSGSDIEAQRDTYIGASEAHELLNEKQYGRGCARALAYRKSGTPEDFPQDLDRRAQTLRGLFMRGHLLEDVAAQLYTKATGRKLIKRHRLVRHPDHFGAAVHTDRIIVWHRDGEGREWPTGDCEIKSHGEGPFLGILRGGLPAGHNLQIQWSMFCTGHSWGAFVILGVFGEMPLKHFDRERDPALMNIFAQAVDNFWNGLEHAELPGQLPDPQDQRCKVCPWRLTCRGEALDPHELARLTAEKSGHKLLTAVRNDELDAALADYDYIVSQLQALDHDSEEHPGALQLVTAHIKELLGDSEAALLVNGRWKVRQWPSIWSGVDVSRLRAEQPELFEKYYVSKRPTGNMTLRVDPVARRER